MCYMCDAPSPRSERKGRGSARWAERASAPQSGHPSFSEFYGIAIHHPLYLKRPSCPLLRRPEIMCGFGTQNVGTDLSFFTQSRTVGPPTTIRITQSIPTLLARNGAAPRNDAGTKRLGSCRVYGTTRLHVNAFGRIYVLFRLPSTGLCICIWGAV
jgi:hypothetical protein